MQQGTKNPKSLKLNKKKVVMVSGGFDPIHIGHIRYIQAAKKLGDTLIVVINNDNWLRKKKGKEFMPAVERKEIIEAISGVDEVVISSHTKNTKDMSVCRELIKIKPNVFANGGDRNKKNAGDPESSLCKDINMCKSLGIEMVYNVGRGGKVRSSSELLKEYSKHIKSK
ncbi:MAG: adenylyltransferase/cytidyltransferase family protein [Candidatus Paceibacterota bacterium]